MTNGFTGFRTTILKVGRWPTLETWQGRAACFENGRRLWQVTANIYRPTRALARLDAQAMAKNHI